jgi:hypothetical protein
MPFVNAPGVVKIELLAHHTTTMIPIANVLHCTAPSPYTLGFAGDVAAAVAGWQLTHTNMWSDQYIIDAVRATDLHVVDGEQATDTTGSGTAGTNGLGGPANVCALIKLITPERSRKGRGRIFISPIDAASVDTNGSITSGYQGDLNTGITDLQTTLAAITSFASTLCVLSRAIGVAHPVVTFACEALAASQRRRIGR